MNNVLTLFNILWTILRNYYFKIMGSTTALNICSVFLGAGTIFGLRVWNEILHGNIQRNTLLRAN